MTRIRTLVALAVATSWLALATLMDAATPTPAAGAGDPRSSGEGPGLVGNPAFAIVGVLAVVVLAVLLSVAYVRLTGGRRDDPAPRTGTRR